MRKSLKQKVFFLIRIGAGLGLLTSAGLFALFLFFAKDLPNPEKLQERRLVESTKIFDRTGEHVLYDIHGEEKRTVIPFDQIPPHLRSATVVAEDDGFYHHYGFDIKSIIRAALTNIQQGKISQGGSTITQQFIKNSLLSSERTFTRKIKEVILSLETELVYSKDEILGFYLNQVPYGSNAYGVEAASQTYFSKSAKDLSLAEAAILASLPKAPTYYSPYGSHPEELEARKNYIIDRMAAQGYIAVEEAERAKKEDIRFSKNRQGITAPHFVIFIREYLDETYGKEFVEQAGLKVTTTLDVELQKKAEELVETYGESNRKKFDAHNAALTAVDPRTGHILAMVGSVDYFDVENDGNVNVALRPRQPGSSFKPFAYAKAFEKGYTPDTIVFDTETEFALGGAPSYKPRDYDGRFRGPVRLRHAIAQSLNVPAVKVLYLAGVSETIDLAKKMGITTLNDRDRYGLALVLGGGEVKLLDMVSAFGVFGQEGVRHPAVGILKIETADGKVLEEYTSKEESVLSPEIARTINQLLSDEEARAPIFGSKSALYFPDSPVAVKTGTTQEFRDAWTVGYTPYISAGVWVGNNNNAEMKGKADGVYAAAPLWHDFMAFAISKMNVPGQFTPPKTIETKKAILNGDYTYTSKVAFDTVSGKRATDLTPQWLKEYREVKEIHSILFWVEKDNPQGDFPKIFDPQFENWEKGVHNWVIAAGLSPEVVTPSSEDDIHTYEKAPLVRIITPKNGTVIKNDDFIVELSLESELGISQIDYFINNRFAASRLLNGEVRSTFSARLTTPQDLDFATLSVRVFDSAGGSGNTSSTIYFLRD